MTDNQGALNHLLHGDVGTAIHDIEVSIGNIFKDDVVPALKAFIEQFLSDFGNQALSVGATLAPKVISGEISMQDAGAQIASQLASIAVTTAEKDGTVALNALRVQITAAQQAQTPVTAPPPQPAA